MDTLIKYLGMPSTWKGMIGIATAFGVGISPEMAKEIAIAGVAIIGAINVMRNEKLNG